MTHLKMHGLCEPPIKLFSRSNESRVDLEESKQYRGEHSNETEREKKA